MRCLARQGELGQALRHYRSLAGFLQEEFATPPDPEMYLLQNETLSDSVSLYNMREI
jgi:DNA-binding SARP family transcriptional activator